MRKWIILAAVVLLLIGAAIFAVMNLNSYLNTNRQWIAEQVQAALGRPVSFGKVSVSLWGGLGVRVENVRIGDDPAFSNGQFVTADDVTVRVKVLPALFGRYEVSRIVLDRPAVVIVRTAEGLNVETIGGKGERPEEPAGASGTAAVAVAYFDIEDGTLRFTDRTAKPPADITVDHLDLTATDVAPNKALTFELGAAVLGATQRNVTISGTVGPVDPKAIDEAAVDLEISADPVVIDDVLRLEQVAAALPPALRASGSISSGLDVKGTVGDASIDGWVDATDTKLAYEGVLDKAAGVPLRVDVDAKRHGDTVQLANVAVAVNNASLTVAGDVDTGERSSFDLTIDSNAIPLAGWNTILGALHGISLDGTIHAKLHAVKTAGAKTPPVVTGTIDVARVGVERGAIDVEGLSTTVTLAKNSVSMEPATFNFGGSQVTLDAKVTDLKRRTCDFTLKSPSLAAASLGVAAEGAATPEELQDLVLAGTARMEDSGLRLEGTLRSVSGILRDFDYRNLAADVTYADSRAVLKPLSLDAFGGSIRGEGRYDLGNPDKPTFAMNVTVRNVGVAELLTPRRLGADRVLEGKLDGDLALTGAGSTWETIRAALSGNGKIRVHDGAIKDVNIAEDLLVALTGVPGLSELLSPKFRREYPSLFSTGDTSFKDLSGTLQIADGRISSKDLALSAADYFVRGRGSVGLDKTIDVTAAFQASDKLTKDLVAEVSAVKYLEAGSGRIEIPFRLTGELPSVRPQPDMSFVTSALQRALVGTLTDKLLDLGTRGSGGAANTAPAGSGSDKAGRETGSASQPKADQQQEPLTGEELLRKGLGDLLGR
jgi:uncharacterized protein involved in outer membrane biogenesis